MEEPSKTTVEKNRVYRSANTIATPVHTHYPTGGMSTTKEYSQKKTIFRTYQVIWYILGVIEVLLAFRLILQLLGASISSGFTSFIYAITTPFVLPFLGILPTNTIGSNALEWSTLIAMIVYAVIAWGIIRLLQLVKPTNPKEVSETIDNP